MNGNDQNLDKLIRKATEQKPLIDSDEAETLISANFGTQLSDHTKEFVNQSTIKKIFKQLNGAGTMMRISSALTIVAAAGVTTFTILNWQSIDSNFGGSIANTEKLTNIDNKTSSGLKNLQKPIKSEIKNLNKKGNSLVTNSNLPKPIKPKKSDDLVQLAYSGKESNEAKSSMNNSKMKNSSSVIDNRYENIDVDGIKPITISKEELAQLGIEVLDDCSLRLYDLSDKTKSRFMSIGSNNQLLNTNLNIETDKIRKQSQFKNIENSFSDEYCTSLVTDLKGNKRFAKLTTNGMNMIFNQIHSLDSEVQKIITSDGKLDSLLINDNKNLEFLINTDSLRFNFKQRININTQDNGDNNVNINSNSIVINKDVLGSETQLNLNQKSINTLMEELKKEGNTELTEADIVKLLKRSDEYQNQIHMEIDNEIQDIEIEVNDQNDIMNIDNAKNMSKEIKIMIIDNQDSSKTLDKNRKIQEKRVYYIDTQHPDNTQALIENEKTYEFKLEVDSNHVESINVDIMNAIDPENFSSEEFLKKYKNQLSDSTLFTIDKVRSKMYKFNFNTQFLDEFNSTSSNEFSWTPDTSLNRMVLIKLKNIDDLINEYAEINKMIPLEVKTCSDDGFIVWLEPTNEVLRLLPEDISRKIKPELKLLEESDNICQTKTITGEETYLDIWKSCSGAIEDFTVFPNPTNGRVNIKYKLLESRNVTLSVHDINGRKIFDINGSEFQSNGNWDRAYELSKLEPGMYLISLQTSEGEKAIQRIVVNK